LPGPVLAGRESQGDKEKPGDAEETLARITGLGKRAGGSHLVRKAPNQPLGEKKREFLKEGLLARKRFRRSDGLITKASGKPFDGTDRRPVKQGFRKKTKN